MNLDITRKCTHCKDSISLDTDNFVYVSEKYYHFDCYVELQLNKKRNKLSKDEIVGNTQKIKEESMVIVQTIITKEKLYRWLQYNYNVVVIPKYFYTKIDSIYNGTYKGLSRVIPPEDLFDMWKRKKVELDRINSANERKGKSIVGSDRLQYDLAIILSKYDSYVKWKEQQKILEMDQIKRIAESKSSKIDFTKINKSVDSKTSSETEIDELLDEVF
jgi:hypothetical protein